ncbi:SAM-dependent methyltransferase [Teredinibacter purpureus]|uniref:SAM-dependent methyltransferase n=1 Tax=Teredinibacter purpureus TaxID=2731756 RepID=UPI000698CEBF|nr:class I SAM-dependent methyltransferase [Teredinibacter purpureus]
MDVGCGWGGSLVYLCEKYGVTGHGITLSGLAVPVAEKKAKEHGVDAGFEKLHWNNLAPRKPYDAIYSDEAIVHFPDLSAYYEKMYKYLKPTGYMVNKELHFTHSKYKHAGDRLSQHINKVYGYSGNYIT